MAPFLWSPMRTQHRDTLMWQQLALSREAELGLEPTSCKYWSTACHSGFSLALVSSCLVLHCMFLLELSQYACVLISGEIDSITRARETKSGNLMD